MKHLFFCLAFSLCFISAKAQNITDDTLKANELYAQAETLKKQSRFDSALLFYRQTLPLYEKHKLWKKYFKSGANEVWCLMSVSKLDSASYYGERYLKEAKEKLTSLSRARANLLHSLAVVYANQSQYSKALEHYQKSLSIKIELLGEKHTSVAATYIGMAIVYNAQSQYSKALEYYQKSLSIYLELLGEKHTSVATTYNSMAIMYANQSQYSKALEYYQKSLSIDLELLEENHESLAMTYNNMAIVYKNQSQYSKALAYYQKSLSIFLELFGEKHTSVASIYNNMAEVYDDQSRYKKALDYYQKSLSIKLELLGEKHTWVAMTYGNLGLLYHELKQYDSAVYFHHKAVKAAVWGFESDEISQNPQAEQALEKNVLIKYLRRKAQALTTLGQEKNALKTYTVASDCAEKAMQEADREEDKLKVASEAYLVYTQAALLHFTQKGRVQKVKKEKKRDSR